MSAAWRGGSSRRQRKVRHLVLVRDGYRCQLQLEGCTTTATTAHHSLGRAVSGDDPAHMVAACAHCNGVVGDPSSGDPPPVQATRW